MGDWSEIGPCVKMASKRMTLSKEDIAHLKETFSGYDKDGDGKISSKELGELLSHWHPAGATETELQDIINDIDVDGDGVIDFGEFLAMMNKGGKNVDNDDAELQAAFEMFDTDGDGQISTSEFFDAMAKLGVSKDEAQVVHKQVFTDGRENIGF